MKTLRKLKVKEYAVEYWNELENENLTEYCNTLERAFECVTELEFDEDVSAISIAQILYDDPKQYELSYRERL